MKDQGTILYLEELLEKANTGEINGFIAYVSEDDHSYLVYTGSLYRSPNEALRGLSEIKDKLNELKLKRLLFL